MFGPMQDRRLLISSLIDHAATFHRRSEIVPRLREGPVRRSNWGSIQRRAKQVAHALKQLGVQPGDRVGTLAWNSDRHLALYVGPRPFAAPRAPQAIIAVPQVKWQERTLLLVVRRVGHDLTREEMLAFLAARVARWWLPGDVVFVPDLPHTATGRLLRSKLREQFKDHVLPDA